MIVKEFRAKTARQQVAAARYHKDGSAGRHPRGLRPRGCRWLPVSYQKKIFFAGLQIATICSMLVTLYHKITL